MTIAPSALAITTTSLPNGVVRGGYSVTLGASGGNAPYSWSITGGALPAGLVLDAATGAITGTPSAPVSATPLTSRVQDSSSTALSATANLTLTISSPTGLAVTTTSLPNGQVGVAYRATLAAAGGITPYSWTITSGSLPAGLSLATATGVISGSPTSIVTASPITVTATDAGSPAATQSAALTITIASATLAITTTSLATAYVGSPYSATLAASGGKAPYSWSLTAGTLPNGLALNAATGSITGTPATTVTNTPLTFQVQDASSPAQSKTASLPMSVNSAITISSISPKTAGVTISQVISISATTNDGAGVSWKTVPGGGLFSPLSSLSGASVSFTAPPSAGVYSVTATSVSDSSKSLSITVGVTDLAGVYTWHNDLARDGVNGQEYALTTSNVNTGSFGKLFSCTVDGAIYAQPLWVANLSVNGAAHNVVFVATAHDSLYAFDADASPCVTLWKISLIDTAHGANSGEVTVPAGVPGYLVGRGFGDITPEVGVIGTPVIDPVAPTLYVVSKSVNSAGSIFYQRLHAIDLTTGNEKSGSPAAIAGTFSNGGSTVTFSSRQENQRTGLVLANGTIYIAWGSHEDTTPWYGWMMGYTYSGTSFTQSAVLNVTPSLGEGGIWMSGAAPSVDAGGNLYVITGNGDFNVSVGDYGDSFLQLNPNLKVSQNFTPTDQSTDNMNDFDFGAGGAAVLADLPANGSNPTHVAMGGGKSGNLYVVNRDQGTMSNAWTVLSIGTPPVGSDGIIFATGAFWNNTFYIAGASEPLTAWSLDTSDVTFPASTLALTPGMYPFPGATPSVSAMGTTPTSGIVWALDNSNFCPPETLLCGPSVLYAYEAGNLTNELWDSTAAADAAGFAVKFTVPTVANGKVYVGTRGIDRGATYGSTSGELDVYGLKPN